MSEWRWLESTRKLQTESFGIDFEAMALDGGMRADYALTNAYALIDEISEAMGEIAWKPWAKDRGSVNRDAMIGELVDAAHFMANLLVMISVTDEEWEERYREKQHRNAKRQQTEGGYDARQDKCPGCGRELDKDGAFTVKRKSPNLQLVECAGCSLVLATIKSTSGEKVAEWEEDLLIRNALIPESGTIHK